MVPLYYQLIQAYQPVTFVAETTPAIVAPAVLGTSATFPAYQSTSTTSKTLTIAVIGDSMIDTLKAGLPVLQNSLRQYFPHAKFNLLNYGYGSTTLESAMARLTQTTHYLDHDNPSVISQNPDIIILESFAYNNFGNTEDGFNRQQQDLTALIDAIHQNLPQTKIMLADTIAPNSLVFGQGVKDLNLTALDRVERSNTIKLYLDKMAQFASSRSLPFADAYHNSLFNNEGLNSFISGDGIHPSPAGAQFFADTVAQALFDSHLVQ